MLSPRLFFLNTQPQDNQPAEESPLQASFNAMLITIGTQLLPYITKIVAALAYLMARFG